VIDPQIVVLRIALAFVLGAFAGIEREWRHKVAGIKTNALVAIGSAAFALMTNTFGDINHNPAQLAAAVVSGIGFIGAGVIIHRGATVQGVTTAATLWANASLGVAVGLGHYAVGIAIFVGVIVVEFGLPPIADFLTAHGPRLREIEVKIECNETSLDAVNSAWGDFAATRKIAGLRLSTLRRSGTAVWRAVFVVAAESGLDLTAFEGSLASIDGIVSVDARQSMPADEMP
jgi:uncharacterized membrane protein YhiD involved in acid resistance